jgi:O-antigen/teichoic acid export membrane protein
MLDKGAAKDVPKDVVSSVVIISCFALPTTALLLLLGRTLRALKEVGSQVLIRSFLQPISRVALILFFLAVLGNQDLKGLAYAIVISAACCCAIALWIVHRRIGLFGKKNSAEIDKREFMSFALPLIGVDILTFLSLNADIFILGLKSSQAEIGTYMAVIRLIPILGIPLFLFSSLLTPLSAELYGQKRMDDLRALYRTSVRWIFAVSLPLTFTALIWADPLLGHLGEGFESGSTAFRVLAVTLILTGFANPAGYAVTMAGYSRVTLANSIVMTITVVILGFWLIPTYGILGAAIANAGAKLANCILTLSEGYIILGLNPLHLGLAKPLLAATIAAFGAWGLLQAGILGYTLLDAVLGGMALTAMYSALTALFGLKDEDKKVLIAGSRPLAGVFRKLASIIGR